MENYEPVKLTLYGERFIDCERPIDNNCKLYCHHYGACIADRNIRDLGEQVYILQMRIKSLEKQLEKRS